MRADVVIVGGGIMGSALAYWLTSLEPALAVCVVERDPTYARASSSLSAASIRQQFGTAINTRISQHSIDFLRAAPELLAVDGQRIDLALRERGYLYLAGPAGAPTLTELHQRQRALGAPVRLLSRGELEHRFPWLATQDLELGSWGERDEGWFDGHALLSGFAARARSQGARYLRNEVVGIELACGRAQAVQLADGTRLPARWIVNCAGPWARAVAALAGIDLPVHARRRTVYVIACPATLVDCPLLIDPSGWWLRPDGSHYITGLPPQPPEPDEPPLDPDYGAFEAEAWPRLAHRIPAFESARLLRAWAGYYEMNEFDHNGIVGAHPAIPNFMFLNGFSGHGMQQAPVVGRGLAELILHGRYRTLDLAPLGYERLLRGERLTEPNVIG